MDRKTGLGILIALILAAIGGFACVLLFQFIFGLFSMTHDRSYKVDSSWVNAVGELTLLDHGGSGGCSRFSYWYNSKYYDDYSNIDFNVYGNVLGEKYIIKLNPHSPEKYVPVGYLPVFEKDEETGTTDGKVTYFRTIDPLLVKKDTLFGGYISFSYTIDGEKYERGQNIRWTSSKALSSNIVNNNYIVEYLVNNPQRAIIRIDGIMK